MSASSVQRRSSFGSGVSTVVLAFTSNNAAHNVLAYFTGCYTSNGIAAATDNNTNTIANANTGTSASADARWDYVADSNSGANTVTAHANSGTNGLHLHIWELTGCVNSSPIRDTGSVLNNSTGSVSTGGSTTAKWDGVLAGFTECGASSGSDAITADASATASSITNDTVSGDTGFTEFKYAAAAGTQTFTCAGNSTHPLTQLIITIISDGAPPPPQVTFAISTTSTSNTTSYATGSFTPALGDLLLVFVVTSATVDAGAVTESLSEVTFTKITSALKASSADTLYAFIANGFLTSGTARTVTFACAGDAATGAIVTVYRIANMGRKGLFAVRQSAIQSNQSAAGTPAPAFTNAALTGNPVLGLIGNASSPAGMTVPSGSSPTWNEGSDNGYATPTTGSETIWVNSGFTGTTITWGSTSATAFGDIIVEIDGSAPFPPILERHRAGHFEPHYLVNF